MDCLKYFPVHYTGGKIQILDFAKPSLFRSLPWLEGLRPGMKDGRKGLLCGKINYPAGSFTMASLPWEEVQPPEES